MAKGCCDCTWRCPLYDSERCSPCRYNSNKPNFESEEHPGYGTKSAAELPQEDKHMKAFRELIDERCKNVSSTFYIPILPPCDFDPFKRDD